MRFIALAILLTGDLLRECAFSSRTSAFDQDRRSNTLERSYTLPNSLGSSARRVALYAGKGSAYRSDRSRGWVKSSRIGARRIDYHQALFFVPTSLCFGKLRAIEVQHEQPNGR